MTETEKLSVNPAKKASLSPKAIIHQTFGDKACYKVEEVQDSTQNECPGLAVQQKGPFLYQCTLQLPDIVVVSDPCRKKKDAEQSAAEKAIEKLGIHQKEYNPTVEEARDDLVDRLTFLFADEFLSSPHPLSAHFRAALRREGEFSGCIPLSVIAVCDAKIGNICKFINPLAEVNLLEVMTQIQKAAEKVPDLIRTYEFEQLSLQRRNPYPNEIKQSSVDHELDLEFQLGKRIPVEVVRIPVSLDKAVESLTLNISATGYYLDDIAPELGMTEASDILISRTIGRASSEMRIYYTAPKQQHPREILVSQLVEASRSETFLNVRATYMTGQEISGTAILASVGYRWKSTDLFHEDVSLRSYYRILVNMIPSGAYRISREAVVAAKLPLAFTTKNNWRGSFPRDILCTFCRFHHLSEPLFSIKSNSLKSSPGANVSRKKLKVNESSKEEKSGEDLAAASEDPAGHNGAFHCEVKIYTKSRHLILKCSPKESFRKQTDATQSTALKVLSWLNVFFEKPDLSREKLNLYAGKLDILLTPDLFKNFVLCHPVHKLESRRLVNFDSSDISKESEPSIDIGGQNAGITPSIGSLACISYTASLVIEEGCTKEHLESCEQFEFEIGNEAVLPHIEAAVIQMGVGQSAHFQMDLLPSDYILAAAGDSSSAISLLSSKSCKLEFNLTLLRVTEPLEERMEQALFSPPLSKQRVEFAVQYIKESSATSLVDFGCGSGSLLDSLLLYPTSLEKIVGVDISQRSLARAAKSLHSKLNRLVDTKDPSSKIKVAVLFDGSITKFDSRLYGFGIATCLEVIEHMEEEDASVFGDVVLSSFCPKILIVSTPNYEYNVILQKSTPQSQEDDPDDKNPPQGCKFRNHDHRFEWTRAQFNEWASGLATKHNYALEFSGVGGAADVEPGFASQIAIFRRRDASPTSMVLVHNYAPIWEWSRKDLPIKEAAA